jgi:MFS transporter, SP family, general alpha glucoside:H+ symporter
MMGNCDLEDQKPEHVGPNNGLPHPSELLEFDTSNLLRSATTTKIDESSANPTKEKSASAQHIEQAQDYNNLLHVDQQAHDATKREHRMTLREGISLYPMAVGWSFLISMAIIMEGFDTALLNSLYTFQEFRKTFGVMVKDGGEYEITAKWQTSLINGSVSGAVVGLFINGVLTEKFGYRRTMGGALVMLAGCISLSFFAQNIEMLLAGQVLCGLSWGVFSTLTTTYAAEVVPLNLRCYLTANVNLCWLLGQIVAVGTLRGLINMDSTWSYRIPFGLQWFWIIMLMAIAVAAPDSPWWLVRKGRLQEAENTLHRLTRRSHNYDIKSIVALMHHTNVAEQKMNGRQNLTYAQCFRGSNLRRTEIACAIFVIQNLSGLPVVSFAAYFYNRLGFTSTRSFDITLGLQGLAILGALVSIPLMKRFGRRQLYLTGLVLQALILTAAGVVSTREETPTTLWATASLILGFIFAFDCAVAPITYCIVAEVPSTRLRVKTVVLARVSYNLCVLITNPLQTRMLNPLDWNWRGKSCFFWAGACVLCLVYCYFRLPETRGLTYLEMDILFDKRASAKQFSKFQKTLASTGYFSFHDQESNDPQWTESRSRSTL